MLYMTHPQHGAMHVYAEAEAVANEKNGWVRGSNAPIVFEIIDKIAIDVIQPSHDGALIDQPILPESPELLREELAKLYNSKFGKKPHHKMAQKTIEAALRE